MDDWQTLASLLGALRSALGRTNATRIGSSSLRESAKEVVQQYFRRVRPNLVSLQCTPVKLEALDDAMQALLQLSNGRSSRHSYASTLHTIGKLRTVLEAEREIRMGATPSVYVAEPLTSMESRTIASLQALIPSAALSYEQAIRDLNNQGRISYRGTANELREVLREVMDHLAPDAEVMAASGFKLENGLTRPTQRQKVRHILRSRQLTDATIKVPLAAVDLITEHTASLARSTYERSAISTHIATSKQEVRKIKMYLDSILVELLEI